MSAAAPPTQKIFRIRRDYNTWVANETLEDYALRYTPRGFRKWSEFRVANTAFGAVSFLALEAIGGAIALNYGFANAMWAILVVGIVIYLTGLPIAVYAARYGVDMDLLTRGAGFGYLGSTLTSLIYASFTFIFFALEAAIMALAIEMAFGWPLVWCYVLASLVIIPLVIHGITLISRLQAWTQPLWLVLFLWPFVWIAFEQPQLFIDFTGLTGRSSGSSGFSPLMFGAAATVAFSLVVQIGEQVDFLRFLPVKTAQNRRRWWTAVLVSGPGWVVPGALKMVGGAFLAFVALQHEVAPEHAVEPTQMYLAGFQQVLQGVPVPGLALAVTVLFVVISQVKINVTNAYAGSLAWSNFFARLTHSHPGRVVWLVFNVVIAVLLMTLGVFGALEKVLGLYSNVAIAWVGALVADLVINKPLGLSPPGIEFRRAYLYDLNPVGLGAMVGAAALACAAYGGLLGETAQAFSSFIALGTAMLVSPLLAWATGGRWYLARTPEALEERWSAPGPFARLSSTPAQRDSARGVRWLPGQLVRCTVCENSFESEDMASCPAYGAPICSLCCTLESRCHDRCKTRSRAAEQIRDGLGLVLPASLSRRVNFRVAHYLVVFTAMAALLVFVLGVVYVQESASTPGGELDLPFVKVFALMALVSAVCAWWVVLASESRHMAQDESSRQTELLQREIDAHRRTDAALQGAKDLAEAANQAKTRYVAGMTHELRTPLNSILGYAQILLRDPRLGQEDHRWLREALGTVQHSGQHMHALIDGLLDLARIEAGRVRLDVAPLPLPEFLDDVLRMVQPQAAAKALALTLKTSGRLPAWVRADAKRLRQILINLLGNAVVFTDQGSVTLRVDCRHDVLRFEVIDTGIGIAPQDQERIFLPFERGSAGRRLAEPGTGLGLTITHLLTELMGGELSVKSEPGAGSTFSVRLYLREVAAPPQPADALPHAAHLRPVIGYLGSRRTLLVVDDQPIQRQLLAALLMPLGFIVREAASGREGLDVIAQQRPDAVLLDVSMDDLDGWQTAELIREMERSGTKLEATAAPPRLPIIFVSANMFENRPEQLAALHCEGFVGKPVVESELLEVLARALQLEWVHQGHTLSPQALPSPAMPPPPWPQEAHAELLRLARLGHAQGVKQGLQQLAQDHPLLAEDCAALRVCADRFDFDALIIALMQRAAPEPADDTL